MFQPNDPTDRRPAPVRGGQFAPVTCAACGCRLERIDGGWFHFGRLGGRDARGCRVPCIELAHGVDGHPVLGFVA